jgi:phenylalanyl-tRNA synthetase beta chain
MVLELELTANRGDLLSVKGVARDLSAKLEKPLLDYPKLELGNLNGEMGTKVRIEAEKGCNRYILKTLTNVRNQESPWWLKLAILKLGLNPISYVVDLTNYILYEMGQPMHSFDLDKLHGDIIVRYARKGEKFKALDERELELDETDLVIADEKGVIALAGVIGGWDSQVDLNTKRVALEFAHFDPVLIRKTARKYGYHTDSSHRFERFVDPEGLPDAVGRALYFYKEIADLDAGYMDLYPHRESEKIATLNLSAIE